MVALSSAKKQFCEVVRVSTLKKFSGTSTKAGNKLFREHKAELIYRSDGVILEKHWVLYRNHQYWDRDYMNRNDFCFGWKVLGKAKESPAQWVKKYKAKKWTVKVNSDKVMSKYISRKDIRRLTDGF